MTTKMQPMAALLTALGVVACNDTQAPNPPFQLVISGGNGQNWYFKNPLPTPLSVTALDVDGSPVSGVVVTWAVTSGSGSGDVNPKQSTTNANGIATTIDSIGTSTLQNVSATFTGLAGPVSFTETATTPPTSVAVDVKDNFFDKASVVVQVNGTVTWTFVGAVGHTVTFNSPGGPDSGTQQIGGTFGPVTFTTVGTQSYHCKVHGGTYGSMNGSVTVVH